MGKMGWERWYGSCGSGGWERCDGSSESGLMGVVRWD